MADVGLAMQRALDKTENMKARADAVQELEAAGTFDDLTALGSGEDDIDRQLKQLSTTSEVDADLAKMKAELAARLSARARASSGAGTAGSQDGGAEPRARRRRAPAPRLPKGRLSDRPDRDRGSVRAPRRATTEELNELDNQAVARLRRPTTRSAFTQRSRSCWTSCGTKGRPIPDDELEART